MQSRNKANLIGIDVSHHNGSIDWNKVIADVKYVFIKASEGVGYKDPNLTLNATGAEKVNLPKGFYHYARPETGNSAKSEAQSFVDSIKGFKAELPHVLDLEGAAANLGKEALTKWAVEWLEEVQKLTGHKVMLYTGASFAKTYCGTALGRYPLWVAHYGGVDTPMNNSIWSKWAVFQFTETGRVSGINGNVDINVMEVEFMNDKSKNDCKGHWAESAIKEVIEAGIMSGRGNGFEPNSPITRAEVATIVSRLLKRG
ncbi:GH25 family lysozyme [Paenibacillus sp. NAIST15-1]|uniref:GH25 family lysozyme n=1 Tax=Paenibacillus sp. NAIST15-1 TaxID=1605994 RepID=UPI00086D56DE|nr:GH25 family lysozyme [Paenibacillus sp. NAIST15-1]GAV11274.1 glycoside hydrolase [Paenibacillus sp. NAIST15-1]